MLGLLLLIGVCTLIFAYLKWNFTYWQRKGFPYDEPKIPFGALDSVRRREHSLGMAINDVYKRTQERVVGIYLMLRPALLVRNAQLARDMLAKDFNSFHDRGIYVDEVHDPMSASLFQLKGSKWKSLRTKLTPSFTSGKLKGMFDTIEDISEKMLAHLDGTLPAEGSVEVEVKNVMTIYAIDIIASVIFGLEVNSFDNCNNEFYGLNRLINQPNFGSVIRGTCQFLYPNLEKLFVRLGWKEAGPAGMKNLVHRTIKFREEHNVVRKDLLQLLLQLRNTGKINTDDNVWTAESKTDAVKTMSEDVIAAQLFLFYVAGFETSASTAAFTLYEFTQYPEVLAKAQQDVEATLQKHGTFSYEAVQDMKYLDLCVMETIRKYPGLPILNRECTQDYLIPGTDKIIEKGTPIVISLFGIHRDEEYFPDPLKYDPERYLKENMRYNPVAYMPFGEGPRHCIAQRMGKVNVKVALAKILSTYEVEPATDRREIEIDNYGIPIYPKGGVPIRFSRKKTSCSKTRQS